MPGRVRLTGEGLASLVARTAQASPLHAQLLATEPAEAISIEVPAQFGSVQVFDLTVHTRRRPIELRVADLGAPSGEVMLLGDGATVDALARRIGLRLETPEQATEYVRFWCRTATRHTEQLVETAADFQWIPGVTTDPDLRGHADRAAHLARKIAVGHPAAGAFPAEVTMLEQRTLHLRQLRVGVDGHVDEVSRVELERDVPVPYTLP